MVCAELAAYLEAQGIGTRGTNIFTDIVPDTDDPNGGSIVCIIEYSGFMSEPDLGTKNLRLVYPLIQVVTRGIKDDTTTPRQKAQDVVTAFVKVLNQTLSGVYYEAIEPRQDPFFLRRDDNFRVEFACNYRVTKGPSLS